MEAPPLMALILVLRKLLGRAKVSKMRITLGHFYNIGV
jgi:hypothetical protein